MAAIALPSPQFAAEALAGRQLRLVVILGMLGGTVSFLDRSVLNILAEPIKRELGFSDTQLGLLTGFAFALFYSTIALPIARYVDRPTTDRPRLIAVCMMLWSIMTAISGLAATYAHLFIARILVAIGESGGAPAMLTLLDSLVPRSMRSRIFGLYGLGVPIGTLSGLLLGGWLVDLVGWRLTFVIVGVPGVVLAVVIWLLLPEPRRKAAAPQAATPHPTLSENFAVILRSRALLWLTAACSLGAFFAIGLPSWTGVYLIRVLDLSPTLAGLILGLTMGIGGGLGSYFGGALADRMAGRDPGRALFVPAMGLLIGIPAAFLAFQATDWRVFAALYWIAVLGAAAYFGPVFALVQLLVEQRQRGTTLIIVIMLANLIGAGLGPLLVGVASDALSGPLGPDALRWVMIGAYCTAVVPAALYLKAMTLAADQVARIDAGVADRARV